MTDRGMPVWRRQDDGTTADGIMSPDAVFRSVRRIGAPFRSGQRFRSLPAVRVWTGRGWVNRVGSALPDEDESLDDFVGRMESAGRAAFAVDVLQPWVEDPDRWSWLRGQAWELWCSEGFPVLPVQTELVLARGTTPPLVAPGDEVWWTWLLAGQATVRGGGGCELPIGRPCRHDSSSPVAPVGDGPAAWVTLRVTVDRRKPVALAAEVLAGELTAARGMGPVPHTDWSLEGGVVPVVAEVAEQVRARAGEPDRARRTALSWVRRLSAAGLEPAPRPRTDPPPTGDGTTSGADRGPAGGTTWRRTAPLVHLRHGEELLVAANGHGFAVPVAAEDLVRDVAQSPSLLDVVPGTARAALVSRLWQLRAVEQVA